MAILAEGRLVAVGDLDELRRRSGSDGTLEQVFARVARSEDPARAADALLSGMRPRS